jgi:hypothetical protein
MEVMVHHTREAVAVEPQLLEVMERGDIQEQQEKVETVLLLLL